MAVAERAHRLYYEVGRMHVQEQWNRRALIENKANWVMGFAAVLMGIMGLVMPEAASWAKWVALPAGIFFLLSILLVYMVLKVASWDLSPKLGSLKSNLNEYTEDVLEEWTGDELTRAVETNNETLDTKADWLKWALHCFAVEAIFVAVIASSVAFNTNENMPLIASG